LLSGLLILLFFGGTAFGLSVGKTVLAAGVPTPAVPHIIGSGDELVPFETCGIAGSNANRCCYSKSKPVRGLWLLRKIPWIGGEIDALTGINDTTGKFQNPCIIGQPSTNDYSLKSCVCGSPQSVKPVKALVELCKQYIKPKTVIGNNGQKKTQNQLKSCVNCAQRGGYLSAIGCIPLKVNSLFASFLINIGIGLAGALAFLCIIYGAISLQTSQGNPEKVKKARETITSCIVGLLFIIFSIFILRVIGVDILKIPFLSGK